MDNCNFTLNRAKWKVMKISFNTTENKCAWEQLLIEYCCHSFGSIRAKKQDTQEVYFHNLHS